MAGGICVSLMREVQCRHSVDEQVCNFLSRCYSVDDRFSLQEFNSALTGLINNHPRILEELVPDLLQTGRLPTRLGLPVIRLMDLRSDEPSRIMRGSSSRRSITKRLVVSYRMRAA